MHGQSDCCRVRGFEVWVHVEGRWEEQWTYGATVFGIRVEAGHGGGRVDVVEMDEDEDVAGWWLVGDGDYMMMMLDAADDADEREREQTWKGRARTPG